MGIFRNSKTKLAKHVEKEKIKIVSSKEDILSMRNACGIVHLCFRPSNKDIFKMVKSCPNMKVLQVTGSAICSISNSAKIFLEMQGIDLRVGTINRMN